MPFDTEKIPNIENIEQIAKYQAMEQRYNQPNNTLYDTLQPQTIAQIKGEAIQLMSDAKMLRKKFGEYRQQPDKPLPAFSDPTYNEAKMQQTRRFQRLISLSTDLDTNYLNWVASLGDLRRVAETYRKDPTEKNYGEYLLAYTAYCKNKGILKGILQQIETIINNNE